MKKYHENNLLSNDRIDFFRSFYAENCDIHSKLENFSKVIVVSALGETLAWLQKVGRDEDVPNCDIDGMLHYIVDSSLFIAFRINVHPMDVDNYYQMVNTRLTQISYQQEIFYENNAKLINQCFATISLNFIDRDLSHLQMVTAIAFICTDYGRSVAKNGDDVNLQVLYDVFAAIKYVGTRLASLGESSYDFDNLFSGTGKKDSGSI